MLFREQNFIFKSAYYGECYAVIAFVLPNIISDTRHINIFIILVTATSYQKSYCYQKKQSFHYRNFFNYS